MNNDVHRHVRENPPCFFVPIRAQRPDFPRDTTLEKWISRFAIVQPVGELFKNMKYEHAFVILITFWR